VIRPVPGDGGTTWRLDLSWHGGGFVGWQRQARGRSVQAELEAALAAVLGGESVRVEAAGRTDAGVHALHQVAAFRARAARPAEGLRKGLNGRLPPDLVCTAAAPVADHFDPRGWVLRKLYRYRLLHREARCPLRADRTWHQPRPLDAGAMAEGAALLVGRRDFSSFRGVRCGARHPVRLLESLSVRQEADELWIEAVGNGFLRHQVRIMAGTLVQVGRGARAPAWVGEALEARDRRAAGPTAPAHGLWLVEVEMGTGPRVPGGPEEGEPPDPEDD
jgi:tRNA pseudouridine38-40 synthase